MMNTEGGGGGGSWWQDSLIRGGITAYRQGLDKNRDEVGGNGQAVASSR